MSPASFVPRRQCGLNQSCPLKVDAGLQHGAAQSSNRTQNCVPNPLRRPGRNSTEVPGLIKCATCRTKSSLIPTSAGVKPKLSSRRPTATPVIGGAPERQTREKTRRVSGGGLRSFRETARHPISKSPSGSAYSHFHILEDEAVLVPRELGDFVAELSGPLRFVGAPQPFRKASAIGPRRKVGPACSLRIAAAPPRSPQDCSSKGGCRELAAPTRHIRGGSSNREQSRRSRRPWAGREGRR